jgi:hypothetical protein
MVWEVRPEGVYCLEGFVFIFEGGKWESGSMRVLDNGRHERLVILGGGGGSVGRCSPTAFYNPSGFLDLDLFARPLFFLRVRSQGGVRAGISPSVY